MHAPPRPGPGKIGCPGLPRPRKFSTLPRPAPPRKIIVLPRPENIDRMFRGKVRGKCSYITKRFCKSKTFGTFETPNVTFRQKSWLFKAKNTHFKQFKTYILRILDQSQTTKKVGFSIRWQVSQQSQIALQHDQVLHHLRGKPVAVRSKDPAGTTEDPLWLGRRCRYGKDDPHKQCQPW